MRLDRLREGLLAGPLVPGGTTDIRPLFGSPAQETPTTNRTIGDMGFQSDLNAAERMAGTSNPVYDRLREKMGIPQLPPVDTSEFTETAAKGELNAALRGGRGPKMRFQTPADQAVLGGLSDLVQGKGMGRMVPEEMPIDVAMEPIGTEEDLPTRPQGPPSEIDREVLEGILKGGPLQDMRPADPSYGDLFKRPRRR